MGPAGAGNGCIANSNQNKPEEQNASQIAQNKPQEQKTFRSSLNEAAEQKTLQIAAKMSVMSRKHRKQQQKLASGAENIQIVD